MSKLSEPDTTLRFITEGDRNSVLLDVDSHRYCGLFHLALSLALPTSLIILNNSIIGMSTVELQKIVKWLHHRIKDTKQQVIIVDRSNSNTLQFNTIQMNRCQLDDSVIA